MHYYKKNIGDYHKKAGRLNMIQHGAYTLLIDSCYDREKFPTLEEAIDWLWASSTEEVEAVEFVLSKFFTLENDVFVQNHIKEDLEKYHKNAETNKRIALEREAKRKENDTKRVRSVNEASPNQEPLTNKPPTTKPVIKDICRFAEFWNLYAKKTDLKKCEAKFKKLTKANVDLIFENLPAYIKSTSDKQFRKNPITWLNNESWNDEIQTPSGQQRNINDISTDFSQPEGYRQMKFDDKGEMIGYER